MPNKRMLPDDRGTRSRDGRDEERALAVFCTIDKLEVGPVRLEKQRLIAPYTVVRKGRTEKSDFICSYDEDVFDPSVPADRNLAAMIAAQVAVNYGLFCRRIVFRGGFDAVDKRFLLEIAENTAREIYVIKLLEPNPFLTEGTEVPYVRRRRYLQAALEFPDSPDGNAIPWSPVESPANRVAVSSSGGKDSLLSFGLLNELGYEVHPIFGNESGRHWYTALNAFRDFKQNIPNTARVWMNSDRLFSFMLRQLPFIRQDFARLRSDDYPIRLWTVAVFLFGALPLLRKRGVGQLIVGDEYDTTERRTHRGITHYNGLFDQSRFFDDLLSRYYAHKKWRLNQFSILRPLSELLIQKTLVQRYPDLFRNQVSCHATHIQGGRVHPCGKCEKCRRIVAMVLAVGGDPGICGYSTRQIADCLESFPVKGVHQESTGAEHLMAMLKDKQILPPESEGRHRARQHPEIMKLRFSRERSPSDGIPVAMRGPLYEMLLEHADGAVSRRGRQWIDVDVKNDPAFHRPYIFERSHPVGGGQRGKKQPKTRHILAELTWPEAQRRFKEVDIALLPVGATEQHGPHLPLDTDAFDADYLARAVAEGCKDPKPTVLPLIPYGVSYHHEEFSGTISITNQTLSKLVYDVGMGAARNGVTKLVIINGHGGNDPALNYAAQQINRDSHIFVAVDTGETSDVDIEAMIDTPNDVHAGEIETSTSLAIRPELVRLDRLEKFVPKFSSRYLNFTSKRSVSWHAYTKKISKSGVMGDPTKASAEKGKKIWEVMIAHLVEFVEELKKMTLDEIHQRKY